MKKKELLRFEDGLLDVANLKGVKFAYAVAKNAHIIKPELQAINIIKKPSKEFQAYEEDRVALCEVHCTRDKETGNALFENGYYMIKDRNKFDKDLEKLRMENAKVISEREKQLEEVDKLISAEEIEIELHKVKVDDLPLDITARQIDNINEMIE